MATALQGPDMGRAGSLCRDLGTLVKRNKNQLCEMDGWMDGWMNAWMNGPDGRTDGRTDGWIDR